MTTQSAVATHSERMPDSGVPFSVSWRIQSSCRSVVEVNLPDRPSTRLGQVYDVAFVINDKVIVSRDALSAEEAEAKCWDMLQTHARPRCSNIHRASQAVATEMGWSIDEGLAVVFAFCRVEFGPLAHAGLRRDETRKKGVGRPPDVDRTTTVVARMAEGWQWLTGRAIGYSDRGFLVRAAEVVAEYFHLGRRDGQPYEELRNRLRAEFNKYIEGVGAWVPTPMTWPAAVKQETE